MAHSMFRALMVLAVLGLAATLSAGPITITFEGVADNSAVGNFYIGQGITFANAFAAIDSDAGGSWSFANEPSASTVVSNFNGNTLATMVMSVAGGFTGPFTFFYNADTIGTVSVKDGLNGAGSTLGSAALGNNRGSCGAAGDPNPPAASGNVSCWTQVSIPFAGTASSVVLASNLGLYFFDNLGLNLVDQGPGIPEPGSLGLMLAGGLALALGRRYLKR